MVIFLGLVLAITYLNTYQSQQISTFQIPDKKYSLRYGLASTIPLPYEDQFCIEKVQLNDVHLQKSITQGGKVTVKATDKQTSNDQKINTADFCSMIDPSLRLQQHQSIEIETICKTGCHLKLVNQKLYVLTPLAYLKIFQLTSNQIKNSRQNGNSMSDEEEGYDTQFNLTFFSEMLIPDKNLNEDNFANFSIISNSINDETIIILGSTSLHIIEFFYSGTNFDKNLQSFDLTSYNIQLPVFVYYIVNYNQIDFYSNLILISDKNMDLSFFEYKVAKDKTLLNELLLLKTLNQKQIITQLELIQQIQLQKEPRLRFMSEFNFTDDLNVTQELISSEDSEEEVILDQNFGQEMLNLKISYIQFINQNYAVALDQANDLLIFFQMDIENSQIRVLTYQESQFDVIKIIYMDKYLYLFGQSKQKQNKYNVIEYFLNISILEKIISPQNQKVVIRSTYLQQQQKYNYLIMNQQVSLESEVFQILPTKQFIFNLQKNMISMTFSRRPDIHHPNRKTDLEENNLSQEILENVQTILGQQDVQQLPRKKFKKIDEEIILMADDFSSKSLSGDMVIKRNFIIGKKFDEIVIYELIKQRSALRCEPKEPYNTGEYQLGIKIGVYNTSNEEFVIYYQEFIFHVYREIFENANVALFVGLAVGLALTFVFLVIFCVYFYRIRTKYQQIMESEFQSSQPITPDEANTVEQEQVPSHVSGSSPTQLSI